MKNLLLVAVAVGSLSLFSFRTASDVKITRNAENPNLYDVSSETATFSSSHKEFPDKFVATRETWTKVSAVFIMENFETSIKEMENVMENL